jgi:hypothetical protein
VLDEVRHYVNGHDVYEADPKEVLGSPAEIAEAVQDKHAEKPQPKRVEIGWQKYKLAPSYDGKTDERSVRKALSQALSRKGQ